jgi:hypothetical protein
MKSMENESAGQTRIPKTKVQKRSQKNTKEINKK